MWAESNRRLWRCFCSLPGFRIEPFSPPPYRNRKTDGCFIDLLIKQHVVVIILFDHMALEAHLAMVECCPSSALAPGST